jgi:hypothetical protein
MHETRVRADDFRKMGEESDDVVFDLALDLIDPLDVECRVAALFPNLCRRFPRDDAKLRHAVRRVRFDLEPDFEARLRRPDRRHLVAGVAEYHSRSPSSGGSYAGQPNLSKQARFS